MVVRRWLLPTRPAALQCWIYTSQHPAPASASNRPTAHHPTAKTHHPLLPQFKFHVSHISSFQLKRVSQSGLNIWRIMA